MWGGDDCQDVYLIDSEEDSIAWSLPGYGSFQATCQPTRALCFE